MTPSDRGTPLPLVQHPQSLHELAPGLSLARGGPGHILNIYLLGSVVLDSGMCWSRRCLARQLAGRQVTAHALTHAHFDPRRLLGLAVPHLGRAAVVRGRRRRRDHKRPGRHPRLAAGQPAAAHPGSRQRHPVSRTLEEGDLVGGFEVLEVPGHSPGALALWRQRDRVLVCGDVVANFGLYPSRPRLVLAPAALSSDYEQNRRSAARLAELRPRLACFGHGFAVTDPGRFAAAVDQLGSTSS